MPLQAGTQVFGEAAKGDHKLWQEKAHAFLMSKSKSQSLATLFQRSQQETDALSAPKHVQQKKASASRESSALDKMFPDADLVVQHHASRIRPGLPRPKANASAGRCQNAIDFPRHVRVSSEYTTVGSVVEELCRQRFLHSRFDPELHSQAKEAMPGIEVPHELPAEEEMDVYIHEYAKSHRHLSRGDPKVRPMMRLKK